MRSCLLSGSTVSRNVIVTNAWNGLTSKYIFTTPLFVKCICTEWSDERHPFASQAAFVGHFVRCARWTLPIFRVSSSSARLMTIACQDRLDYKQIRTLHVVCLTDSQNCNVRIPLFIRLCACDECNSLISAVCLYDTCDGTLMYS